MRTRPARSGRGHRPCHSAALASGPAGGQSPRPAPDPPPAGARPAPGGRPTRPRRAPDPPPAGASHPPGWALACVPPGPAGLQGTVPRGRGNAGRVSCSRPEGRKHPHRFNGRGHRPCQSAAPGSGPAGGQSPRPAPDPPMAGASHPPGRALACVVPGPTDLQGTVARGRGNAVRFLFPPGMASRLSGGSG